MLEYNKDVYLPRPRSGEISSRPRHHLQAKPGLSISKPIHGTPHTETDKEKHDVSLGFPLISRGSKGSVNVLNVHSWHEPIAAVHSILGLVFIEGTSQEQGSNICFLSSHPPSVFDKILKDASVRPKVKGERAFDGRERASDKAGPTTVYFVWVDQSYRGNFVSISTQQKVNNIRLQQRSDNSQLQIIHHGRQGKFLFCIFLTQNCVYGNFCASIASQRG